MMNRITVFTPTYNRLKTLTRTYDSLRSQTCQEFDWLIIDDGSTDSTKELVDSWIKEDHIFKLHYIYKENGGLHTGYNTAIEFIKTELCVCIDSDDYMPIDAIERILKFWKENKNEHVGGIMGLDFYADSNQPIGGYFPEGIKTLKIIDMAPRYNHHGDVKVVHRTSLLKEVAPMPTFKNEKNFNPIYLFHLIDIKYPLLLLNENLCYVDYQPDGMSNNIYKQYVNSPRSFAELRKLLMSRHDVSIKFKFRQAIHYIASEIFIKNPLWLKESPQKILTLLACPLGFCLYLYIKYKVRK